MLDLDLDLRPHLNLVDVDIDEVELLGIRDAAVRLVESHPDLLPEAKPLDTSDPLMRFALLELIRDMYVGTQSGAGGRTFGQDFGVDATPMVTPGRPALPPYVLGLLQPFLRSSQGGPVGSFPEPAVWPAW